MLGGMADGKLIRAELFLKHQLLVLFIVMDKSPLDEHWDVCSIALKNILLVKNP
jgi:hypothetical protein